MFQIYIEMKGKCNFQMTLNGLKFDFLEFFGWKDNAMYFKNLLEHLT